MFNSRMGGAPGDRGPFHDERLLPAVLSAANVPDSERL
jgi:hypothetical protein